MTLVIGNIIALIASVLMVYTGTIKKKKRIIYVQSIHIGLSVISNAVLGGISGAIINILNLIRNILCYKDKLGLKEKLVISIISIGLILYFNNLGLIGLLPLICAIVYLWLMTTKNIIKFKLLIIFTMILWIIYDLTIKSYTSSVFDIMCALTNAISIIKITRLRKNLKYKYVILDFGKVIAGPAAGNWDTTPKFLELIDINKIDKKEFKKVREKYGYLLSAKITTLEEEYNMFVNFYDGILKDLKYPNYDKKLAEAIAYDRTYKYSKYTLYDNIHKELETLKNKYTVIMLTDNWPCVYDYLKENNLDQYFDKIYVSSIYGVEKKDKVFFDYPINDYNIKPGEALFIDDLDTNLDVAKGKGLDVLQMDREGVIKDSRHKIIHDLDNI